MQAHTDSPAGSARLCQRVSEVRNVGIEPGSTHSAEPITVVTPAAQAIGTHNSESTNHQLRVAGAAV
jgi:hypothetical protein